MLKRILLGCTIFAIVACCWQIPTGNATAKDTDGEVSPTPTIGVERPEMPEGIITIKEHLRKVRKNDTAAKYKRFMSKIRGAKK